MADNVTKNKFKKSDIAVVKWMLSVGKRQIPKLIIIILANAFWASLSVIFANFSKNVIDAAVVDHSTKKVVTYAVALFGVIMLQLTMNLLSNSFSERCKGRLDMTFKKYLLGQIMKKDYTSVTAYHTGELQNRLFNDVEVITDGLTTIVPNSVYYIVKLICAFVYLVIIDKIFALLFLCGGLLIFLCMSMFRTTLKRLHNKVQETEGKTRSFFQETVINLLVVKSFASENKILNEADELQETNFKAKMKRRFMHVASSGAVSSVFNLGYVFALTFGAFRLVGGTISYGTVTAMLQLVNQVQIPLANLSSTFPKYFSMIASAERLMEICNLPDEAECNGEDINVEEAYEALKAINFDNITFKYDRDLILDKTSLSIKKGDFVAIMGISGIGKSTLLKLLLGVFSVQGGSISLKLSNRDIPVDKHTRRLFAYVPQGNMLLSGTIKENLTFINENATDKQIEQAINVSCAKEFIDELPQGLETVIGEKGMGLSEGQLQRLAIARSLLSGSPVLLLDEATSALDEATEKKLLTNLKCLKNVTCIIVSHKKAALEICNKYVRIENGKIISEGE